MQKKHGGKIERRINTLESLIEEIRERGYNLDIKILFRRLMNWLAQQNY